MRAIWNRLAGLSRAFNLYNFERRKQCRDSTQCISPCNGFCNTRFNCYISSQHLQQATNIFLFYLYNHLYGTNQKNVLKFGYTWL